jgi:predicted transport protein
VDDEVRQFVAVAAERAGWTPDELLRRVLHVDGVFVQPEARRLFARSSPEYRRLLSQLDEEVRALNPGLHYVFRASYLGFRRERERSGQGDASRSQTFLSVIGRINLLTLVLPLDPSEYCSFPGARDLRGVGHQGVGSLGIEVPDEPALRQFLGEFDQWLGGRNRST